MRAIDVAEGGDSGMLICLAFTQYASSDPELPQDGCRWLGTLFEASN